MDLGNFNQHLASLVQRNGFTVRQDTFRVVKIETTNEFFFDSSSVEHAAWMPDESAG